MAYPSPLRSFARFAAHRLRLAGGAAGDEASDRPSVTADKLRASPRSLSRYLRATEGAGLAGEDGVPALIPPVFPCVWETALFMDLLRVGGFPLPRRGIVHLGGERTYLRGAHPADELRLRLWVEAEEPTRRGTTLEIGSELSRASGQPVTKGVTRMSLRDGRMGAAEKGRAADERGREEGEAVGWRELCRWRVGPGAGRRYAAVSGDFNPIHLSRVTARALGFRRPILHGFCIEAMIAHALVERVLGGDVTALRWMGIRFSAPLELPGEAILWTAPAPAGGSARYRLTPADPAAKPFAEGSYLGARAATPQG